MMGKMDPWCQVTTAYQKVRTRTLDGAGKTPNWETTFSIKVCNDQENIKFSVFDEDVMKNDTVGEETYTIKDIMKEGEEYDNWMPIKYKGKQSGQVHIKTRWFPEKKEGEESSSESEEEKKPSAVETAAQPNAAAQ